MMGHIRLIALVVVAGCAPGTPVRVVVSPELSGDDAIISAGAGVAIDEYLRSAAALGFSGVVLVAEGSKILLHQGYGWADRDRGVPFRPSDPFGLASVAKQFTAAAILRLQDLGRLSVRDSVAKHLAGWPEDKSGITIHHLLTHTSGLPLDVGSDDESIGREELLRRAMGAKLAQTPGTRWVYSNLGYSLLAAIIEIVSGEPYDQFVQREIFQPAGMLHTRFATPDADPARYCGYRAFQSECIPSRTTFDAGKPSWTLIGGAGLRSTAGDLYRWDRALAAGRVLSDSARASAVAAHAPISGTRAAGYGWFIQTTPDDRVAYHTGGNGIISVKYERHLGRPLTMVQFSNNGAGVYRAITSEIAKLARGAVVEPIPSATIALSHTELAQYCGTYVTSAGRRLRVDLKNGQLHVPLDSTDVEVTALISGQPHFATEEQRTTAVSLARAVLSEVARGDLSTLLQFLPSGADVADERWFWSTFWPTMIEGQGALLRVEYLGSARPTATAADSAPAGVQVRLLAYFERGSQFIRAHTSGDGTWTFSPSYQAPLPPGSFHFIAVGADRFLTRTFPTGTDAELIFERQGSSVGGLRLTTSKAAVSARRESACR